MNKILYDNRCKCNEKLNVSGKKKGGKAKKQSEGRPLQYPTSSEIKIRSKIFQLNYQNNLSPIAKSILTSFQNKYVYYAFDDILYSFKSNPVERDNLLAVLYSPILSLQNNFSVNFFDIWIREVYIDEISKTNKFLNKKSQPLKQYHSITIQFFYKTRVPVKKQKSLW